MNDAQDGGGIFINYRRNDSGNTLRDHAILVEALARRLARHFGESAVFVDTSMSSGTRYPDRLRARLTTSHVLLAVIHPQWLDDLHQRQDTPGPDWVLDEISSALNRSPYATDRTTQHTAVIPILIENAELPNADKLPERIRRLADLHAFRFRSGSLAGDIARLLDELESLVPASWRPSPEAEPKRSDESFWITMVAFVAASVGFQLLLTNVRLIVILFVLMIVCMFVMTAALLAAAMSWAFGRQLYRADEQTQSVPITAQNRLIFTGGILGGVLVPFYINMSQNAADEGSPLQFEAKLTFVSLVGFTLLLFAGMAFFAQALREDREWPPMVSTQPVSGRSGSLRGAAVLLEQRLTSSWRPPLSRVQRDQAQHIVRQLSKATEALRGGAERGRFSLLRTEHRGAGVAYAILLIGTVGLSASCTYLLIEMGHTGRWLYLAILTLVLAPGMCLSAMELWFRYECRQKRWLAAEIEESLEKRLRPYLPPDFSRVPSPSTAFAATRRSRSSHLGADPPLPDHTETADSHALKDR